MRLLLDTHTALWWTQDNPRLSQAVIEALEDPETTALLSAAVVWEVAIKRAIGKLQAPDTYIDILLEGGAEPLHVTFDHARRVEHLPVLHRDPFDRLLIAQAHAERATIVTHDPWIERYDVPVLW